MKTLTLKNRFQTNATLLPNDFIDNYMIDANGEFVKVYLFLLRHLDDPCSSLTITTIADCLNNTENDILRAFRYWENTGLLSVERDAEGKITGLELQKTARAGKTSVSAPVPENSQPEAAPAPKTAPVPEAKAKAVPIDSFRAQKEIKSLLFIAEQYLGKTLTHSEMETITYFYDTLHMSADLIEYLLESCVENGHKVCITFRRVRSRGLKQVSNPLHRQRKNQRSTAAAVTLCLMLLESKTAGLPPLNLHISENGRRSTVLLLIYRRSLPPHNKCNPPAQL